MGHLFTTIPDHNRHTIMRNTRWAQVIGPLVDYIHNMNYAPRRIVREEGGVDEGPPPHPNFTMKGRSASKLLRQVDACHGHLAREGDVLFQSWQPCGLRPYEMSETHEKIGDVRWTVQEMLSSWELSAEGRAMNHCVVSYSDQCADGNTSVWSIAAQKPGDEERESVMTVAVDVRSREMTAGAWEVQCATQSTPKVRSSEAGGEDRLFRSAEPIGSHFAAVDGAGAYRPS